jgi:sirohydrochlorin cobaltochelatase
VSEQSLEQMLEAEFVAGSLVIGEVAIRPLNGGAFELTHRGSDTAPNADFAEGQALEIAKFDDAGEYRPLRTAPNLRHGWKIVTPNLPAAIEVIDALYPGRLAAWRAWKTGGLTTTSLRATLNRQTGMYRVAARISDEQLDHLVGNFCRSDGGCLRTILWQRDETGVVSSTNLPLQKFDPAFDQTGRGEKCIPLLCQEACNLLVAASREVVKAEKTPSARVDIPG